MVIHHLITIPAKPYGAHLITTDVLNQIQLQGSGLLHLFIQHTSAALAINENASPDVLSDVSDFFSKIVPEGSHYQHNEEGPDDMPAHIKSILCHTSLSIPFQEGKLMLGIWQGIYLLEFRKNARARRIVLSLLS